MKGWNYTIWADTRVIELVKNLTQVQFTNSLNGQRSAKDLAIHLMATYKFPLPPFDFDEYDNYMKTQSKKRKDVIFKEWENLLQDCLVKFETYENDQVTFELGTDRRITMSFEDYLATIVDHSTYHRAQIVYLYKVITGNEGINTDMGKFLATTKS